jgi:hypothetical protein
MVIGPNLSAQAVGQHRYYRIEQSDRLIGESRKVLEGFVIVFWKDSGGQCRSTSLIQREATSFPNR